MPLMSMLVQEAKNKLNSGENIQLIDESVDLQCKWNGLNSLLFSSDNMPKEGFYINSGLGQ